MEEVGLQDGDAEQRSQCHGEVVGHAPVAHHLAALRGGGDVAGVGQRGGEEERDAGPAGEPRRPQKDGVGDQSVAERARGEEHRAQRDVALAPLLVYEPAGEGAQANRDDARSAEQRADEGRRAAERVDEDGEDGKEEDEAGEEGERGEEDIEEVAGEDALAGGRRRPAHTIAAAVCISTAAYPRIRTSAIFTRPPRERRGRPEGI